MEIRHKVGQNVEELRKALGLSQEQLGFDTGLHRTYISGIERGIRNPTATVLERLAAGLKVTPGMLLDRQPGQKLK